MVEYFGRTDDEGPDAAGGGRLNTRLWTERRQKGRKERGDRKDALEGKTRVNLGGGEKEGTRTITAGNTNRNLNTGTESRVQIADALGKELHHPKMSKIWDSETGPTDRQTAIHEKKGKKIK